MNTLQRPLFEPDSDWVAPSLSRLPNWGPAKRICVDLETRDPDIKSLGPGELRNGKVVGIAFTIDGTDHSYYLPIAHEGGGNLPEDKVWAYIRDQAAAFRGELVAANAQYDLGYFMANDVHFKPSFVRDPQIAAPLLDELQMSYSLQAIADREGIPGKDESGMIAAARAWGIRNVKADLWRLPAKHVAEYAIQDTVLPLQLLDAMEPRIDEQGLRQVYDLECRVLPILLKMRHRGVRVDLSHLTNIEAWCEREEEISRAALKEVSGKTLLHVWKAESVAGVLHACGIEMERTPKTGKPKLDKAFLDTVNHPAAEIILRMRKISKIKSTFCQSLRDHEINGRIHCSFNQLRRQREAGGGLAGAAYGRLSSQNPNLQQQPSRDPEIGSSWRQLFVPEEGKLWACLDFSSQEPRLVSHYAASAQCRGGQLIADAYNEDPRLDFHQKMADLAGIGRKEAKTIFLGLCYGMGGGKLCRQLGLPTQKKVSTFSGKEYEAAGHEGQVIINRFHEMVPFVRELSRRCEGRAGSIGYITTLLGRRCRFPLDDNGKFDWTYKALNRLIQGSAADQTKAAMVALDEAGFELQLQVHDEVDLSVNTREEAEEAARIMERAVELVVPVVCDVEVGPSWGQIS